MDKAVKNSIIKFAKQKLGRDDLEFQIKEEKHHNKPYLILVVDCAKMDKNSPEYDEGYYNLLTRADEPKPSGIYFNFDDRVLDIVTSYFKKYMNLDLGSWFNYKNYDYIDDIETKIEDAIKKSSHPEIQIGFRGSGEKPKLSLYLYNVPPEFMRDNIKDKNDYKKYIQELNNLTGFDLKQYSIGVTMADKK